MADDPLARWRRPGSEAVQSPAKETGGGTVMAATPVQYKAFGLAEGVVQRVWFKCGPRAVDHAPASGYLTNILTDGWSGATLVYSALSLVVEIRGECLGPLVEALMKGSCEWVQVFEPAKHIDPPEGIAIVRDITIHDKPTEKITAH